MRQLECSSKCFEMYYLNAPEKNEKLLSTVKIRTANVIFAETSFVVCMLSNSGNEKQKILFVTVNTNKTKNERV